MAPTVKDMQSLPPPSVDRFNTRDADSSDQSVVEDAVLNIESGQPVIEDGGKRNAGW